MFSTSRDGIPKNTFAGFLGPAEATAIVGSGGERGTNRHLRKNRYTRLSSDGKRCGEDMGRRDLWRDLRRPIFRDDLHYSILLSARVLSLITPSNIDNLMSDRDK